MTSIRFYFQYNRKNRLNKNGEALLQLVAYKPRSKTKTKHKYISTKIYLRPDQWSPDHALILKHPNAARLNYRITDFKRDYEAKVLRLVNIKGECKLEDLKLQSKNNYLSFIEFFEKEIEISKRTKAEGTIKTYNTTLIKLKDFRSHIFFDDLNYRLIQAFDSFLHSQKLMQTVITKYHKIVKYMINQAIRKDIVDANQNPYAKFTLRSGQSKPRVFLTVNEVLRIEQLEFDPEEKYLEKLRDAFLFSCYTSLRYSTNMSLKLSMFIKEDGHFLLKTKAKKTGKFIHIPLKNLFPISGSKYSKPESILMKYEKLNKVIYGKNYLNLPLFGKLNNQVANRRLKIISQRATIEKKVTTHTGRHTFGAYMADKIPLHLLQAIMNHSDIKTTIVYTHLNNKMISDSLNQIQW